MARPLELPPTFTADSNHRWGLAPYHYEDGYYIEAMRLLEMATTMEPLGIKPTSSLQ